jgi:hypothetical protein
MPGRTSGSSPHFPTRKEPDHEQPAQDQPDGRRQARPRRCAWLGMDPAPYARAQHAEDEEAEPERRKNGTHDVEARAPLGRGVRDPPCQDEDREHDHDLAREDPPPGEVRGEEAPDQRSDGDRDRTCGRDQPIGGGTPLRREVAGDERDDRRQDQRGADSFQEGPAEQEHRQAGRERRRERAAAVDDAADRERTLSSDQRPDLGAGDHQCRHHERVGGDRSLDAGDRRVDVLRNRRDRDVHHRTVERHQELPCREREQHEHRSARARRDCGLRRAHAVILPGGVDDRTSGGEECRRVSRRQGGDPVADRAGETVAIAWSARRGRFSVRPCPSPFRW